MTIIELLHAEGPRAGKVWIGAAFGESLPDTWSWILDSLCRECGCAEADITCIERDGLPDAVAVRGVVVASVASHTC